ncbi:hypothetical protein L2E82_10691 [Cichorium intybus]|uniref:Uncharacterized protein n=1 Tax=Cichorium intybus TaxID=13427 RepID=A0ACB9GBX5_CICIN|nr:hypothetical protein L2E82_10691 [Cichorium intybus]
MDELWRVSGRRQWEIARVFIDSQNIGRRLFAGNLEWLAMDGNNLTMEMSRTMDAPTSINQMFFDFRITNLDSCNSSISLTSIGKPISEILGI